jgi:hypothetical protein
MGLSLEPAGAFFGDFIHENAADALDDAEAG